MKVYHKLVRDRIPEICTKNGQKANTSVLDEVSYQQALRKKLVEEVNEYLESGETEELADIVEVIDALAKSAGSSFQTVLSIKEAKAAKNGKFEKRLFLDSVE